MRTCRAPTGTQSTATSSTLRRIEHVEGALAAHRPRAAHLLVALHRGEQVAVARQDGEEAAPRREPAEDDAALGGAVAVVGDGVGLDGRAPGWLLDDLRIRHGVDLGLERGAAGPAP